MSKAPDHKSSSELSLDVFAALVAADEELPESVRQIIATCCGMGTTELLAAIERAIGQASEA